jgi:hypothetical protein
VKNKSLFSIRKPEKKEQTRRIAVKLKKPMLALPIVYRELLTASRSPLTYRGRAIIAALGIAF